jgi:hypothetical protein
MVEVADVFIRANCAKAGSGSDLSCGSVKFARTGGVLPGYLLTYLITCLIS